MASTAVAHQFDDLGQQHEADLLGMWTFLTTEILLFGGIFLAYAVCRSLYPDAWAEGSSHNDLTIGTINTAVLLTSSLTAALAVHSAERGLWRETNRLLQLTVFLGLCFLGLKFFEYYEHYVEGVFPVLHFEFQGPHANQVSLFFVLYFAMTGLHALHMIVGVGVLGVLAVLIRARRVRNVVPVELCTLYWHLVDAIWVFLFPLLYLI